MTITEIVTYVLQYYINIVLFMLFSEGKIEKTKQNRLLNKLILTSCKSDYYCNINSNYYINISERKIGEDRNKIAVHRPLDQVDAGRSRG